MQLNQVLWLVGVVVSRHDSLLRERENLKFKKGSEKMQVFDDVTSSGDWKALSIVVLSYWISNENWIAETFFQLTDVVSWENFLSFKVSFNFLAIFRE